MSGRSIFRLLLLLYPFWFRERFRTEMVAEFDGARGRCKTRHETGKFWLGILWDSLATIPRAWWHRWTVWPLHRDPHAERERQVTANLYKDIQLAFRALRRRPGPALVAVLALGLGIGLTAGMFSIVNGVILKGLPVEEPHELVAVNRINPAQGPSRLLSRSHDFVDLQERQTTFEALAAYEFAAFNLSSGDGPPELVTGANVTANTFDLLKTPPVTGRGFAPEDEVIEAPSVAIIGYQFWKDSGEVRLVEMPANTGPRGGSTRPYGLKMDSRDRPWATLFGTNKIVMIDPATFEPTYYDLPEEGARLTCPQEWYHILC